MKGRKVVNDLCMNEEIRSEETNAGPSIFKITKEPDNGPAEAFGTEEAY